MPQPLIDSDSSDPSLDSNTTPRSRSNKPLVRGDSESSFLANTLASFTRSSSSGKKAAASLNASPSSNSDGFVKIHKSNSNHLFDQGDTTLTTNNNNNSSVTSTPSLEKEQPPITSSCTTSSSNHTLETTQAEVKVSPLERILNNPDAKPLPGHPGNLTSAQSIALLQLTQLLQQDGALQDPSQPPPSYQQTQLLRFLRARSFDVEAARTMYLKAEQWKKEIQLDKLVQEFVFTEKEAVAKCGWKMCMFLRSHHSWAVTSWLTNRSWFWVSFTFQDFHKVDKLGRPIFIQDLSGIDTVNLFKVTTPNRVIQNFAVTLELAVRHRYEACTLSSQRWVDDNMMVINLSGLGLSTFWAMKGQLQQLLSVLDNNFPELSGRVQIINAPYMFSTIWSWIKGWLPVATAEKIDIAGYDYHSLIYKYVGKQDWPKTLGGDCCCQERGCCNSDSGPWDRKLVGSD